MHRLMRAASFAFLLNVAIPSGFPQLRNLSEYSQDRINTDKTYFMLQEKDAADFVWASEWSHVTANAYPEKMAMFLWHFKDGSKAYSQQGDLIGDLGQMTGYLLTNQSANLEDVRRKKIQPLSRSNYPVKLELWIGVVENSTGFTQEMLVDAACFDANSIEYNRPYHFANCK
jgi:hypothetical protein